MKIISTLLLCSFLPVCLWATSSTLSGSYIVGYNNQLKILKTKKIAITIPDTVEPTDAIAATVIANLTIEGEDLFPARFTDGKATVYVRTPQEFSYYRLDINPPKENYSNTSRVVSRWNGVTSFCNEGTTALLTAYRGDGSSATFCTKLAP